MVREYKYIDLESFFKEFKEDYVELTFKDIERIAGVPLEKSAYTYYAYWQPSPTHTITLSWINAGFKKDNLNIKEQKISFVRDKNIAGITPDRVIKQKETTAVKKDNKCKRKALVDIDQLLESATCFMQVFNSDNHSRYQSWEHCYKNFVAYKDKELTEEVVDYLSLHLAFYLASWGMLRGSSFLLQKDYTVHKDTVKDCIRINTKNSGVSPAKKL